MLSKKGLRVLSQRAKHILESSCPAKCMSTAPEEEKYKVRGRNVLDVMKERPLVGDGGMVIALEKRGYVTAGNWTPEAVLEYPEAVRQLHREFLRAGSDVLQSFTFYAAEGKLKSSSTGKNYTVAEINQAGCDLVKEVAAEGDALTCGGLSPTPSYGQGKGKQAVQDEFRKQVEIYMEHDLDFMLAEFFATIEETEWAIEVMKASGKPCGATMRIGPTSDKSDVDSGECAVRMAAAGADLVGVNCSFGPVTSLKTIEKMKTSLDAAGLEPFLVMQPVAFHTGDCEHNKDGYHEVPEFPLALESRSITRWDARKYARAAYDLGVRYIGGCCGFEPYHIREIAEELALNYIEVFGVDAVFKSGPNKLIKKFDLAPERGSRPPGADKNEQFGEAIKYSLLEYMRNRVGKDYWYGINAKRPSP